MRTTLRSLIFVILGASPFLHAEVAQEAYLKASNTDQEPGFSVPGLPSGDNFGTAVAVSGNTIVIGAPIEDGDASGDQSGIGNLLSGACYVFVRDGTTWSQQAYLKASNALPTAQFGGSVAISGDTIVVGARAAASAYVFVRNGTTWTEQAILTASALDGADDFGSAVAIDGDTIVVGAPGEAGGIGGAGADENDNSAPDSGAAYVFVRSGATWSQQKFLKASNPEGSATPGSIFSIEPGDRFGSAVAISGDTIAVGAPNEDSAAAGIGGDQNDNSAPLSGAVYVFRRLGASAWVQQAYIKASNPGGDVAFLSQDGDGFGAAVTISGDLLVVGAPGEASSASGVGGDEEDDSLTDAGAAYVFSRSGTTWSQEAYLKSSAPDAGDGFGGSVSLAGETLAVGVPNESSVFTGVDSGGESDNNATAAGAVYVFSKSAGVWSAVHYLKASYIKANPEADNGGFSLNDLLGAFGAPEQEPELDSFDHFGSSVAIDGTLVVSGSPFEDSSATGVDGDQTNSESVDAGAAYTFDLDAQPPAPQADIGVQQPPGRDLANALSDVNFGLVGAGSSVTKNFVLINDGEVALGDIAVDVGGAQAADFGFAPGQPATLAAGAARAFAITFAPTGGGERVATLRIASDDPDENPFTVELRGISVSQASDQDGDGMGDLAEYALRRLGFDWRVRQTGLVSHYYATASAAGLYELRGIETLLAPSPVIRRDPATGRFKVTIDWKRSGDLLSFEDFPATPPGVWVNPAGDIEFEFDAPGDSNLFILEAGK